MDLNKLFDYINIFFTDSKRFKDIPPNIKEKHFFMLNRFMSIKYPLAASYLTFKNINVVHATDLWHEQMKSYKKVPGWIYTPAKADTITKKEYLPDEEVIRLYCKENEIGLKTLKKAIVYNLDEIKKIEFEFKKIIKCKK